MLRAIVNLIDAGWIDYQHYHSPFTRLQSGLAHIRAVSNWATASKLRRQESNLQGNELTARRYCQ